MGRLRLRLRAIANVGDISLTEISSHFAAPHSDKSRSDVLHILRRPISAPMTNHISNGSDDRLLRLPLERLGIFRSYFYAGIKRGDFP